MAASVDQEAFIRFLKEHAGTLSPTEEILRLQLLSYLHEVLANEYPHISGQCPLWLQSSFTPDNKPIDPLEMDFTWEEGYKSLVDLSGSQEIGMFQGGMICTIETTLVRRMSQRDGTIPRTSNFRETWVGQRSDDDYYDVLQEDLKQESPSPERKEKKDKHRAVETEFDLVVEYVTYTIIATIEQIQPLKRKLRFHADVITTSDGPTPKWHDIKSTVKDVLAGYNASGQRIQAETFPPIGGFQASGSISK